MIVSVTTKSPLPIEECSLLELSKNAVGVSKGIGSASTRDILVSDTAQAPIFITRYWNAMVDVALAIWKGVSRMPTRIWAYIRSAFYENQSDQVVCSVDRSYSKFLSVQLGNIERKHSSVQLGNIEQKLSEVIADLDRVDFLFEMLKSKSADVKLNRTGDVLHAHVLKAFDDCSDSLREKIHAKIRAPFLRRKPGQDRNFKINERWVSIDDPHFASLVLKELPHSFWVSTALLLLSIELREEAKVLMGDFLALQGFE